MRVGDGTANPYLAIAATLFAGLHGLREEMRLPDAIEGDAYTQEQDNPLPGSLTEALDALERDAYIRDALGAPITETFLAMKRFEAERHRQWVSDWERDEYLHHL